MTRAIVLAAGMGSRLGALTESLPKTLLPVDPERTILDVIVANLAAVAVTDVAIVCGFAAERIAERVDSLEREHSVSVSLVPNTRVDRNNCYSLWLAMDTVTAPTLVVNGDTLHPAAVERRLLAAPRSPVTLALDTVKLLGDEEMKVTVGPRGHASRIHKSIEPGSAAGEYIGVCLIDPDAAARVTAALETTWRHDPGLYYEDGFQRYLDGGGTVATAPIGACTWVEVDNEADLARAREIASEL